MRRLAVALSIVVSLGLGLVFASAQMGGSAPPDRSPLTVPIGRMGDTFEYGLLERDSSQGEWVPGDSYRWTALQTRRSPDRIGEVHNAVQYRWSGGTTDAIDLDVLLDVDLETRDVIRLELGGAGKGTGGARFAQRIATFGPDAETFLVDWELFGVQGKTFALGDNLDVSTSYPSYEALLQSSDLAMSRRVVDRARIDGRDAYALLLRLEGTSVVSNGSHLTHSTLVDIEEKTGEDFTAEFEIEIKNWVTAAIPYPVLTEVKERFEPNATDPMVRERMSVLSQYEAGRHAIPWGKDGAEHYRTWNIDIERSPAGSPFPADGTGSTIAYPLSAAVASVLEDPTLTSFQSWRQSHPSHVLAVASYRDRRDVEPVAQPWWLLDWGDSTGTFAVTSERRGPLPVSVNRQVGEGASGVRATGTDHPVTIAGVEGLWRSVAGPAFLSKPINFVSFSGAGLEVGVWEDEFVPGFTVNMSFLSVDVDTGELIRFQEYGAAFPTPALVGGATAPPSRARAGSAAPIVLGPPEIDRAALASLSVLAILATVYFLPLLKYVGAQGLLLFPGYARLRREELLHHGIRDEIMQLIHGEPGINASEIKRKIGIGWGTVVHHLNKLEKNHLVSSLIDGRQRAFFPVGVVDFSRRGQLTVLRNQRTRTIYGMIAEEPGLVQGDIAHRVRISVPSTIWHLRRLEEAGLVGRDRQGRKVHYYPADPELYAAPYNPKDAVEVA